MLSTEIEKFARLIIENDLLFKIVDNWGTVPIYVEDKLCSYQRTIAIGNNLEDYQSLTAHLNRCLKVYYGDDCTASLDTITRLLDKHRELIEQVIDDPNPDRQVFLVVAGKKHKAKIKELLGWFMLLGEKFSNKEFRVEELDNK